MSRENAGYEIINSMKIGENEVVLGAKKEGYVKYVTWECKDGNNYFWGHYHTDLLTAQKDFCERCLKNVRFLENVKKTTKSELER